MYGALNSSNSVSGYGSRMIVILGGTPPALKSRGEGSRFMHRHGRWQGGGHPQMSNLPSTDVSLFRRRNKSFWERPIRRTWHPHLAPE